MKVKNGILIYSLLFFFVISPMEQTPRRSGRKRKIVDRYMHDTNELKFVQRKTRRTESKKTAGELAQKRPKVLIQTSLRYVLKEKKNKPKSGTERAKGKGKESGGKKTAVTKKRKPKKKKTPAPTRYVWVDLETTGLSAWKDVILESACIITDDQLNVLEEGDNLVAHYPQEVLSARMGQKVTKMHTISGLLDRIKESQLTIKDLEEQTVALIKRHCSNKWKTYIAGSSVGFDKRFMWKHMPEAEKLMHFRNLNVSSLAVLIKGLYPNHPHNIYKKKYDHRALGDIRESLGELKHLIKHFFKTPEQAMADTGQLTSASSG